MALPISKVLDMKKRGLSNSQIINELKKQNLSKEEIREAIAQSDIKDQIEAPMPSSRIPPLPPMPPIPQASVSKMPRMGRNEPELPDYPQENFQFPEEAPSPTPFYPQPQYDELSLSSDTPPSMIAPSPSSMRQSMQPMQQEFMSRDVSERIQEIAESIIQEKWDDFISRIGDIRIWKEKVDTNVVSIKQEILRTNQRFENLEKAVISKTHDYQRTMEDVSSEIKTLEKVFEKIINPLTENIKELARITKELKKRT